MNEEETRLAEALRERRQSPRSTGDRERDYRSGAPCMDCGDYPGLRHEDSDCPRAVARALLPTVRALIAEAREEGRREARPPQPHNHTRFSNNGGPWSPCPRTCPAALDPQ